MSTELIVSITLLGIIVFLFLLRNIFIRHRNDADLAFAMIDVQLKQRYDLIPNLINTAKAYMKHESETLTAIAALRSKAKSLGSEKSDEIIDLNNQLNRSMRSLMVNVESYPDLKANEQFVMIQRSMNENEAQISAARRAFNAAITEYNNCVQTFPLCLIASMFNFKTRKLFEIIEEERVNPNAATLFGI